MTYWQIARAIKLLTVTTHGQGLSEVPDAAMMLIQLAAAFGLFLPLLGGQSLHVTIEDLTDDAAYQYINTYDHVLVIFRK